MRQLSPIGLFVATGPSASAFLSQAIRVRRQLTDDAPMPRTEESPPFPRVPLRRTPSSAIECSPSVQAALLAGLPAQLLEPWFALRYSRFTVRTGVPTGEPDVPPLDEEQEVNRPKAIGYLE